MAMKMKSNLNCTGVNLLHAAGKDAQQSVFHFHLHVIPRYNNDGLDLWFHGKQHNNDFETILNKLKYEL